MKLKIIEVSDYVLAVSEEKVKEGDLILSIKTDNIFKADSIEYLDSHNMIEDFDKSFYINSKYAKKIIAYQPKGNAPELDLPLLPETISEPFITEDRVYGIDIQNYEFDTSPKTWDDKKFISEAEIQGNVYSLEGFITAFNKTEINQDNLIIRFIKSNIIVEDDVEELAKESNLKREFPSRGYGEDEFIEGYKAATKIYNEEDLRKYTSILDDIQKDLADYQNEVGIGMMDDDQWQQLFIDRIIASVTSYEKLSLKQPKIKWFVAEMEYFYHSSKEFYSDAGFIKCSKGQYEGIKKEIPTCPLKTELKTTTINGKTYLVGKYLFAVEAK
jgi:hypothetical protein